MPLSMEEFRAFTPQKKTYALFGYPIGHTMSPALHQMLFASCEQDAEYIAIAVPPADLAEAVSLARQKLSGINLTIPHKKEIIPLLDRIDRSAADLQSVNTVAFIGDKAAGYNTDILGFASSLGKDDVKLKNKKVLLLGYGGAAAVMAYHCVQSGAYLTITGRNMEKADALRQQLLNHFPNTKIAICTRRHIPKDIQVVINGTPLGMTPNESVKPLYFLPRKTEYLFDAIYNPPVTALMRLANPRKTKVRDGLHMLVLQAAHAQRIWNGNEVNDILCDRIVKRLYGQLAVKRLYEVHQKQNLVLCGFMGAGKTTVGRKLAKLCDLEFIDVDRYLEDQEGQSIPQIFSSSGEEAFRALETKYIQELAQRKGLVIALGGGAVLRQQNVASLKATGLLIHLDTPLYRILQNLSGSTNRPLIQSKNSEETKKLYHSRKDIYLRVADRSVRAIKLNDMTERILKSI